MIGLHDVSTLSFALTAVAAGSTSSVVLVVVVVVARAVTSVDFGGRETLVLLLPLGVVLHLVLLGGVACNHIAKETTPLASVRHVGTIPRASVNHILGLAAGVGAGQDLLPPSRQVIVGHVNNDGVAGLSSDAAVSGHTLGTAISGLKLTIVVGPLSPIGEVVVPALAVARVFLIIFVVPTG